LANTNSLKGFFMNFCQRVTTIVAATILGLATVVAIASPASAVSLPNGPYQIRPLNSSKCVDITGVSYANGAYAQLYDCLGGGQYNQLFFFDLVPGTSDRYQIKAEHSGKCLDVTGVSQDPGARLQQYDCLGYTQTNQIFATLYFGTDYWITATHSWQNVTWQGLFNGAAVFQFGAVDARWVIVRP
jgi:hypothetical protein